VPVLLNLLGTIQKLSFGDSSVFIQLDTFKVDPELIVESQIDDQKFEYAFCDQTFFKRTWVNQFFAGSSVGSHQDRLGLE